MNGKLKSNRGFILSFIFSVFFTGIFNVRGQITGYVFDTNNKSITFGNVILKVKDEIITYTITDDKGFFLLDVKKKVLIA